MKKNEVIEEKIEIEMLAERIKLLWGFIADFIPHLSKLEEVMKTATERSSMTLSMAPILGAFGQDYEEVYFQKEIERKRSAALFNLIKVLADTENKRIEFTKKQQSKKAGLAEIHRALGI